MQDWTLVTSRPKTVVRWIAATSIAVLAAQYMSFAAAATTSLERDAQVMRWYASRPRLADADLTAPGKVQVVVFSDYECAFCSIRVPEFEKVVERYRAGGHTQIELIVKDCPLNSDCNPVMQARMHAAACEAAAAIRLIARERGDAEARAASTAFYRRGGRVTSADVAQHIASLGMTDAFKRDYAAVVERVKLDGRLGEKLGVTGTPTVFIDGRLVRNLTPNVLEAILDYHVSGQRDNGLRPSE